MMMMIMMITTTKEHIYVLPNPRVQWRFTIPFVILSQMFSVLHSLLRALKILYYDYHRFCYLRKCKAVITVIYDSL